MMIPRRHAALVQRDLDLFPAVVLLGPRQVGKTTLARDIAARHPRAVYLDLEDPADLARLGTAASYLRKLRDRLVILDEVQRAPELFRALRGQIDARRRDGRGNAHFLLLGSASGALLRQSSESLAGRVVYRELPGFDALEAGSDLDRLWLRGGFPASFLADAATADRKASDAVGDEVSFRWRIDFIRTYLERDLPQAGLRAPAETLRRLWTMLCHRQGSTMNAAELASSLGVSVPSVNRYADALVDMMLLRRLQPYYVNVGKRLVRSPRMLVRDSGVAHALLNLRSIHDLLGHPVAGASWEAFVIENLVAAAPFGTDAFFYRTRSGAEIDLLLLLPGQELWAIEVKRSSAPKVPRGFLVAAEDVAAAEKFIVYGGTETYPLRHGVTAIPLPALMTRLIAWR